MFLLKAGISHIIHCQRGLFGLIALVCFHLLVKLLKIGLSVRKHWPCPDKAMPQDPILKESSWRSWGSYKACFGLDKIRTLAEQSHVLLRAEVSDTGEALEIRGRKPNATTKEWHVNGEVPFGRFVPKGNKRDTQLAFVLSAF